MASLKHVETFGRVRIPISSEVGLTACYEAVKWVDLIKTWRITMYPTEPATRESVEMSSITLLPIFIKDYRKGEIIEEKRDTAIASESSLKKDWLKPEEDEAWRSL